MSEVYLFMILGVWWILCLGVVVQLLAAYYWLLIFVTVVLRDCFFNVCAVPLCAALKIDNVQRRSVLGFLRLTRNGCFPIPQLRYAGGQREKRKIAYVPK